MEDLRCCERATASLAAQAANAQLPPLSPSLLACPNPLPLPPLAQANMKVSGHRPSHVCPRMTIDPIRTSVDTLEYAPVLKYDGNISADDVVRQSLNLTSKVYFKREIISCKFLTVGN